MEKLGSGYVLQEDDVETVAFDFGATKILNDPDTTGAEQITLGLTVLNPGKAHERHNHPDAEEVIYVLSGQGEQMIADEPPVPIGPGATIQIPQGVYHATRNTGWEPLRLLIIYSPIGVEKVIRDEQGGTVVPPGEPLG